MLVAYVQLCRSYVQIVYQLSVVYLRTVYQPFINQHICQIEGAGRFPSSSSAQSEDPPSLCLLCRQLVALLLTSPLVPWAAAAALQCTVLPEEAVHKRQPHTGTYSFLWQCNPAAAAHGDKGDISNKLPAGSITDKENVDPQPAKKQKKRTCQLTLFDSHTD